MVYTRTQEQIEGIRVAAQLVARTLEELIRAVRAGVTTAELDALAILRPTKAMSGLPGALA